MKTKLLAISGKLRNGKDTLAKHIKAELSHHLMLLDYDTYYNQCGEVVVNISFSDPIKEAVWKIFPDLTKDDLWGTSENRSKVIPNHVNASGDPLTIRDCLTFIGALGRSWYENCWAEATIKKANKLIKRNRIVIITDCRYKNEKKAIEDAGGKVIRIIRPDVQGTSTDPSEIDLDDVPLTDYYRVVINSSLDELYSQAKDIVKEIL